MIAPFISCYIGHQSPPLLLISAVKFAFQFWDKSKCINENKIKHKFSRIIYHRSHKSGKVFKNSFVIQIIFLTLLFEILTYPTYPTEVVPAQEHNFRIASSSTQHFSFCLLKTKGISRDVILTLKLYYFITVAINWAVSLDSVFLYLLHERIRTQ